MGIGDFQPANKFVQAGYIRLAQDTRGIGAQRQTFTANPNLQRRNLVFRRSRKRFDQINDLAPHFWICDFGKSPVELKALGAVEEIDHEGC